jgi:hypothetical protein
VDELPAVFQRLFLEGTEVLVVFGFFHHPLQARAITLTVAYTIIRNAARAPIDI